MGFKMKVIKKGKGWVRVQESFYMLQALKLGGFWGNGVDKTGLSASAKWYWLLYL